MREINLISKRKGDFLKSKKVIKIFYFVSIFCLFLTFISSIGIFLIKLNSPLPALKEEEARLIDNLSLAKQKMTELSILDERLKSISDVLSKRSDFVKTIDLIVNKTTDIKINSFSIEKKKISISSTSDSLNSIDLFLNGLTSVALDKKFFSKITLNNLTSDFKTGKYSFSLDIDLL